MNLHQIHNVYFIGIGGIGMSALARYFNHLGKRVCGYDKTPTDITDALMEQGISVYFEDEIQHIPEVFRNKDNTLVVITPAIPKAHTQWGYFVNHSFAILKRAEVLGLITKDTFCYAVAGTHGKTTTSAILGHILYQSKIDVTAFLGGIAENYDSNLIGTGKSVSVVEADEFDRSFLHLSPDIACVTSMDADHLDIYGNQQSIEDTFRTFAAKIEDDSRLFVPFGMTIAGTTVGVNEPLATFNATHIKIIGGAYHFSVVTGAQVFSDLTFYLPGRHNLMNALMAFAMAYTTGVSVENIKTALANFRGIQRRFSYQIKTDKLVYIDDYAHHPTEIEAIHQAVRELYPNEKILTVFQPHLFSRTYDFADDFAKRLSQFDTVLLLDIYPARELPMEGVTSEWLLSKMTNDSKQVVTKTQLIAKVLESDAKIIITLGAGDIGAMVKPLKEKLYEKIF